MKYLPWLGIYSVSLILILLPLNASNSFVFLNSSVVLAQNDSGSMGSNATGAAGERGLSGSSGASGSTGSSNSGGSASGAGGKSTGGNNSTYAGSDFDSGNTAAQNKANANAGATSGNSNNNGGSKSNGGPAPGPNTVGGTPGAPGAISPTYNPGVASPTGNKGSATGVGGTISAAQREALAKAHIYTAGEGAVLGIHPENLVHGDGTRLSTTEVGVLNFVGKALGYDNPAYSSTVKAMESRYKTIVGYSGGDTQAQNVPGRYLTPQEQEQYLADLGVAKPRTLAQQYALDKLVAACQAGCESIPESMTYSSYANPNAPRHIVYARVGIESALYAANTSLQATNREKLYVTSGAGDVGVLHTGTGQIDNNAGGVDVVAIASDGTGALSVSQIKAAQAAMTAAGLEYRLEAPIGDPTAAKLRAAGITVAEYSNVTGLHFSTGISAESLAAHPQYAQNSSDENARTPFNNTLNNPGNALASGYTATYSTTQVAGVPSTGPASSDPLTALAGAYHTVIADQQTIADLQKIYANGDGTMPKTLPAQTQAQIAALNKEMAMAQNTISTATTPNPNTGVSSSGLETHVLLSASDILRKPAPPGGTQTASKPPSSQPVSLGGGLTAVSQGNMTIEGGTSVNVQNVYTGYGTPQQKLVEMRETPIQSQTASSQNNKNKSKSGAAVYLSYIAGAISNYDSWFWSTIGSYGIQATPR